MEKAKTYLVLENPEMVDHPKRHGEMGGIDKEGRQIIYTRCMYRFIFIAAPGMTFDERLEMAVKHAKWKLQKFIENL